MVKYFEWGKKGGCIIANNKIECIEKLKETFPENFKIAEELESVDGNKIISFVFHKKVESSESTKKLVEACK